MGQKGSLGELSLSARRQTGELLGRRSVEPLLARETVFSPAAFPPETEPRFGSSLKYFVTVVLSFCDRPPTHTDSATWDPHLPLGSTNKDEGRMGRPRDCRAGHRNP